jgi:hypothetical protein
MTPRRDYVDSLNDILVASRFEQIGQNLSDEEDT